MKICILNSSNPKNIHVESDEYVDLRDRNSCYLDGKVVKQNRSWHSWAYALETEFFVYNKPRWPGVFQYDAVIVLVNRDIDLVLPLVKQLKDAGKKVSISFHEGVQDLLHEPNKWISLKNAVETADFYINIFGQYNDFFRGWFGKDKIKFVNHTAPFDWDHGLTIPWEERTEDILCGTRTLNQKLSRNTFVTLATLSGLKNREVSLITEDGVAKDVSDAIKSFGLNNIKVHQGPLEYNEWLKFLSNYRYVVHSDNSMNLSQITFDCALIDVFCVGSSGWTNLVTRTSERFSPYSFEDNRNLINLVDLAEWRDFSDLKNMFKNFRFGLNEVKEDLLRVFE